jgi:esterase/lipase superfamily enzyme
MKRACHRWHSKALEREMELLVFGAGGARVLVFPNSMGRFFDWEDRGMIAAIGEPVEKEELQVFCLDSVDAESWCARWRKPVERVARHIAYDRYVFEEVLPFTLQQNDNPYLVLTGASFGAYHALNFGCRHPQGVGRILAMSGLYDIKHLLDGWYDDAVYFNNPCDYLGNEHEKERLEALRRIDLILAVGRDDPNRGSNEALSRILWEKGIWHALRIWDGWAHDWPFWQRMLQLYIGGYD